MPDPSMEKLLAAVLTVASYAGKTGGADPADVVDRYHEIHRLLHAAEQRAHPDQPSPEGPFGATAT